MAESYDRIIRVVVARAPIPSRVEGVGAQLNHAERNAHSRMSVAVATGADPDFDVLADRFLRRPRRGFRVRTHRSKGWLSNAAE